LQRTYTLFSLKHTTPGQDPSLCHASARYTFCFVRTEKRLENKLALQEFGSALTLARAFGLSTDPVYQVRIGVSL
jgi:hypothetical protein